MSDPKDNKQIIFDRLEKISKNQTQSPLYSINDFLVLEDNDFHKVVKIINPKIRFKELLKKDFMGKLFKRLLGSSVSLNEGYMNKSDFINSIKADLSKTFESNVLLNGTNLWYKGEKWELIDDDVTVVDLENFIKASLFIPGVFKINITDIDRIAKSVTSQVYSKESGNNNIYQFNNYYIEEGKICQGIYKKSLPKFIIDEDLELRDDIELPKELYELVSHLCNHNERAIETLLDHVAMIYCNSYDMRQAVAKAVYLYGTTGENGKSTFLNILSELVGVENTHSISDLSDKSDRFQALNSMVALFPDAEKYWGSVECEFIKQGVTADKMSGRDLYKSAVSKRYSFSIFIATNHLIKVEDKTGALFRRLLVISCHNKLRKPNEWFTKLKSKETISQAISYFVNRFKQITERKSWELHNFSEADYALQMFRNNADIVSHYVESNSVTAEWLDYRPTRYVYRNFLEFCYEVGIDQRNVLQMNNFNSQLETVIPEIKQDRAKGRTILNQLNTHEIYCGGTHEANGYGSDDPRSYIREWEEDRLENKYRVWRKKDDED